MSKGIPTGRMSIKGAAMAGGGDGGESSARQRAEIERLLQDLQLMTNRIHEAKGEPVPSSPSASQHHISPSTTITTTTAAVSPFVTGLRALAESERKASETKLSHLQQLLERISEYDRLILSKTAPPETSSSGQPYRRKSMGADLHSLPSHLRLVDRLLDLYNQSKRVTVIRQTVSGKTSEDERGKGPSEEDINNNNKILIDSLKSSLGKTTIKLDEVEKKYQQIENDRSKDQILITQLQTQIIDLQHQLQGKEREIVRQAEEINQLKEQGQIKDRQITSLETRYREENGNGQMELSALQHRLEESHASLQSLLRTLLGRANAIRNQQYNLQSNIVSDQEGKKDYGDLSEEFKQAFKLLDSSIYQHFLGLEQEKNLLLSVKEMLENEISSHSIQKDLIQSDLNSLMGEHEALKAAYHALSYESASQQRKLSSHQVLEDEIESWKKKAKDIQDELEELQSKQQMKAVVDNSSEQMILTLEEQIRILNGENVRLTTTVTSQKEEIIQYKKLMENYKNKMKELSSSSTQNKENNFFDSFEEVMQEEMMTMKIAFEAKLKAARDETELLAKKHQQEIGRLQQTRSPYSFFNNGLASSSSITNTMASSKGGGITGSMSSR
eukprot:gene8612-9491_t